MLSRTFRAVNRVVAWHRLPRYLAAANLLSFRETLREKNLHGTDQLASNDKAPTPPDPKPEYVYRRTSDGTYNDLAHPTMGCAGTRFGRNVPLAEAYPDRGADLLTPSPRVISERLLKRTEFVEAKTLNLLAAAWIQFMTHDWFDHGRPVNGKGERERAFDVPLDPSDLGPDGKPVGWFESPMRIWRTPPDPTRRLEDDGPPTYRNFGSHWWDASQIYGNSDEQTRGLRCPDDANGGADKGKLRVFRQNLQSLPEEQKQVLKGRMTEMAAQAAPGHGAAAAAMHADALGGPKLAFKSTEQQELEETFEETLPPGQIQDVVEQAGVTNNWWLGLSLLHTVFVKEHNAIVDRLRAEYPQWSGDKLFHTARLINTALMAKIHTVEWTPTILGHPALRIAMDANWWGLVTERITRLLGRVSDSEAVSGIPGSATDHHTAPYALTEEFVAVYRMHALMPDGIDFFGYADGRFRYRAEMPDLAGPRTLSPYTEHGLSRADALYSFGVRSPGALVLHNYPNWMRKLARVATDADGKPVVDHIDLAAIDVMRDRERGVPRYNRFRRLLNLRPARTFADITSNRQWQKELHDVYGGDVEKVDTMVGMYAEDLPAGFGFSDTAFRVFILMASRRLKSDRFFTTDFNANVYTQAGLRWLNDNDMTSVLLRHYPMLGPSLRLAKSAFHPWPEVKDVLMGREPAPPPPPAPHPGPGVVDGPPDPSA
ncbi:MAG TPA: peroxidase family protein [Humisphaera sp.]